jgi:hypothetical protein
MVRGSPQRTIMGCLVTLIRSVGLPVSWSRNEQGCRVTTIAGRQKGWQQRGRLIAPAHIEGASQSVRDFIKQYADGAFDPAVISILEEAFDDAWRRVQASKAPSSAEEYAPAAQMILAKYIIEAAQTGERDPRWLADSALLYLSRQKLSRTPPNDIP